MSSKVEIENYICDSGLVFAVSRAECSIMVEKTRMHLSQALKCQTLRCQMRDHADRNASLKVGQHLLEREVRPTADKTQEPLKDKPHTAGRRGGRVSKEAGVIRSQDAKRDHLSLMQGKETVTRMASRKRDRSGWMSAPQLPLTNYGCHWSSPYGTCLRQPLT